MSATKKVAKKVPTLVEFALAEKRATCKVCKIPVAVRGQLGRPATQRKIGLEQQLRYIAAVTGIKITPDEFRFHYNGRHDGPA